MGKPMSAAMKGIDNVGKVSTFGATATITRANI